MTDQLTIAQGKKKFIDSLVSYFFDIHSHLRSLEMYRFANKIKKVICMYALSEWSCLDFEELSEYHLSGRQYNVLLWNNFSNVNFWFKFFDGGDISKKCGISSVVTTGIYFNSLRVFFFFVLWYVVCSSTPSPPRCRKCKNSGKFWKNQGTSGVPLQPFLGPLKQI